MKKIGVIVVVEQCPKSQSIGPRIAEHCQKHFFNYLDAPITTITGLDIPNPVSKRLETVAVPNIESVKELIKKAVQRRL